MDARKTIAQKKNMIFLFVFAALYLLLFAEVGSRLFWAYKGVPFFRPSEIIYTFYPGLRDVRQKLNNKKGESFDILLLGESTLNKKFSYIDEILRDKLSQKTKRAIEIYNLAQPAHTSLDSYYKYKHLEDFNFNLVLFYHGINDVRANNCPPSFFRGDYSHYSWYNALNEFEKHKEINFLAFPFTFSYLLMKIKEKIGSVNYIPTHVPKKEWLAYGGDIKTTISFRENLTKIIKIAGIKKERVLLLTYYFYVPADYSLTKFLQKSLDYDFYLFPIEMWGKPENVIAGITAHNAIIDEVAKRYCHSDVYFVDQNKLIPKQGRYADDICHLNRQGCEIFVDNILNVIIKIMQET